MILLLAAAYLIMGFFYAMVATAALAAMAVVLVIYSLGFLTCTLAAKVLSRTPPTWDLHRPKAPKFKDWVERFADYAPVTVGCIVGLSVPLYFGIYMSTH